MGTLSSSSNAFRGLRVAMFLIVATPFAADARPAAVDPRATRVVIIHPGPGPSTTISFEGTRVHVLKAGEAVRFAIPPGVAGRIRAGRGGDTLAGEWPVFYHAVAPQPSRTITLTIELESSQRMVTGEVYTGSGRLSFPTTVKAVGSGRFAVVSPARAKAVLRAMDVEDRGQLKLKPAP